MMIGKGVGAVRNRDRLWFRLILAVTFIGILALNLFTPLLAFTAIVLFYFALKRFTPFLLPYLAHVKRPSGKPSA